MGLPKSVEFIDYSSIQIREKYYSFGSKREDWPTEEQKTWPDFDVVITSQQSAAMWVGTAKWTEADGLVFNDEGTIYPKRETARPSSATWRVWPCCPRES